MLSKNHMILSEKHKEPELEQLPALALLLPLAYQRQHLALHTLDEKNHVLSHVQLQQKISLLNLKN